MLYQANGDASFTKAELWHNGRWKITAASMTSSPAWPPHAIGQQVQTVGVAVSENDRLCRNIYLSAESLFEPM
ncbi:MAG: hypothetical protein J2P21_02785 [Chloracidobacterium sp.]|nr:hypothetical protein [Chloracidobacterium sp.]